ncbi:MAG TPA: hypothetical protein PKK00_03705 [Bacteroidales bacterium]|nr:hypothetical protein [Bacteroidales bacterium]HPS16515.1 hypothetical protein [Bacteroidales bacterium]
MKKLFIYTLIISSFVGLLVSCDPNDNNDDTTDPRDKFVGNWTCNENSNQNVSSSFTVAITLNSGNSSQIYLSNFYHLGTSQKVYAVVAGDNANIPEQTVSGFTIKSGSGSIYNSNTKISWKYNVSDGADIDTCTAEFTKQ